MYMAFPKSLTIPSPWNHKFMVTTGFELYHTSNTQQERRIENKPILRDFSNIIHYLFYPHVHTHTHAHPVNIAKDIHYYVLNRKLTQCSAVT